MRLSRSVSSKLVVSASLRSIAKDKPRLRNDSRKVRLAVFRNTLVHLLAMAGHILIILEHEAALHDEIIRIFRKPSVQSRLLKPPQGIKEGLLLVIDVCDRVFCRSGIIRHRAFLQLYESEKSAVDISVLKFAISLLEKILVHLTSLDLSRRDIIKQSAGSLIILLVKQIKRMTIIYLRHEHRIRILRHELLYPGLIAGHIHYHLTQDRTSFSISTDNPICHTAEKMTGASMHSAFLQTENLTILLHGRVSVNSRNGKQRGSQSCHYIFHVHHQTKILQI